MTENEAIERLEEDSCYECAYGCESAAFCDAEDCGLKNAVKMAIQALKEIQRQKTKIGMFVTLEERVEISSRFAKLEQYEAIGTIEEFKALKEKNEPKEVTYQLDTRGV